MTSSTLAFGRDPFALSASATASPISSTPVRATRKLPPTGYAIATLSNGRFLPLLILSPDHNRLESFVLCRLSRDDDPVPQALGLQPGGDDCICSTYDEALWWCERRTETTRLLSQAAVAALHSECYPERNKWYREEIERLLHEAGYCWPKQSESGDKEMRNAEGNGPFCVVEAQDCPRLLAWLEVTVQADNRENLAGTETQSENNDTSLLWGNERKHCPILNLHVEAANPDELWERLYEALSRVIASFHRKDADDESLPIAKTSS